MDITVRQASPEDSQAWLELLNSTVGPDYPDKSTLDPAWVTNELSPSESRHETWVVETSDGIQGSTTFLNPSSKNINPVANIGRTLLVKEAYSNGAAEALVRKINEIALTKGNIATHRVPVDDNQQQILLEQNGYSCVGFQPSKHVISVRQGFLFYYRFFKDDALSRIPVSESLSQVSEIAATVLNALDFPPPESVRDGATGYPLKTDLKFDEVPIAEFRLCRTQIKSENPPEEISGGFNQGKGFVRNDKSDNTKALIGRNGDQIVAAIAYNIDDCDRCLRVIDGFSVDDLSLGSLCQDLVKRSESEYGSVYTEIDILVSAPQLLKSAEQLGFVPVAYMPAIYSKGDAQADVVKMVKLNMVYSPEEVNVTSSARKIIGIIDQNFQDQKLGLAIINLLRELPIFKGLGDGELRKIARLFTQKLFRPGELIFNKGESGNEAYVVMRGLVDILLSEGSQPIAQIKNGEILGELAFLDGAPRTAIAITNQPSILLVIKRTSFSDLVQREPHLGMVIVRNIALELSNRLRNTNQVLTDSK